MMKKIIVLGLFVLLAMGAGFNALGFGVEAAMKEKANKQQQQVAKDPDPAKSMTIQQASQHFIGNQTAIEQGKGLYGNTCLFCHGPKGVGARAPTLVSKGFAPGGVMDDESFFDIIKYGRMGTIMGAFEGTLTETEMWQVIAYLRDEADKVASK